MDNTGFLAFNVIDIFFQDLMDLVELCRMHIDDGFLGAGVI
jgi:hypothetical protein